jgi:hypothetical protein
MKKITTFISPDGEMLTGDAAIDAWETQQSRCDCGGDGLRSRAIPGSAGEQKALWLGCRHCSDSTVGFPLVYRTQEEVDAHNRLWESDNKVSIRIQDHATSCPLGPVQVDKRKLKGRKQYDSFLAGDILSSGDCKKIGVSPNTMIDWD